MRPARLQIARAFWVPRPGAARKKLASHTQHQMTAFQLPALRNHQSHPAFNCSICLPLRPRASQLHQYHRLELLHPIVTHARVSSTFHRAQLLMRQAPVSKPADQKFGAPRTRCRTGRFPPQASRRHRCSRGSISTSTRTPPSPTATPATSSQYLISLYPFVSAHRPHTSTYTHTRFPTPMSLPPTSRTPPPFMYPMYSSLPGHRPANMVPT